MKISEDFENRNRYDSHLSIGLYAPEHLSMLGNFKYTYLKTTKQLIYVIYGDTCLMHCDCIHIV